MQQHLIGKTPDDFKVMAIVCVYNEADIIAPCLERLIGQGIDVYLVDNWSKDNTFGIASRFLKKGLVGIERFPPEGREAGGHDYRRLLVHVEKLTRKLKADWFIRHDVDEYRESCWMHMNLRDAIYHVDQSGFNAIDYTVIEFKMTDDLFSPGEDFVDYFKYWDFGHHSGNFVQIRTWKNGEYIVDLANSGGHQAVFTGRKVFPLKFLLRHYPFRSEEQAIRKLFHERHDGIEGAEAKKRGWGVQYDLFKKRDTYFEDKNTLYYFDDSFYSDFCDERLYGTGIEKRPT